MSEIELSKLRALQQDFQGAVLDNAVKSGLFARDAGEGGFTLYANAYRARLAAALRDNYPVLHVALGDALFNVLAEGYIAQHPSQFRSIRWFGDKLAAFMVENEGLSPHPALCDLARMDWALRQAFDAADDTALAVEDLSVLSADDWPGQRFRLRAATVILQLDWNVGPLWHAVNNDATAETEAPQPLRHALLVWRPGLECKWRSLSLAEAAGLQALSDGRTFAEICECMMDVDETMSSNMAARTLRLWVEHSVLVKEPGC